VSVPLGQRFHSDRLLFSLDFCFEVVRSAIPPPPLCGTASLLPVWVRSDGPRSPGTILLGLLPFRGSLSLVNSTKKSRSLLRQCLAFGPATRLILFWSLDERTGVGFRPLLTPRSPRSLFSTAAKGFRCSFLPVAVSAILPDRHFFGFLLFFSA